MKRKKLKDKYPKPKKRKPPKRKSSLLNNSRDDSDESYVPEEDIVIPKVSTRKGSTKNDVTKKSISNTDNNQDNESDDFDEDKLYIPQDAVVVPRKYNKKFEESKFDLTKRQLTYYTHLLDKNLSNEYYQLDSETERDSMVQQIIRDNFTETCLFKYNEKSQEFQKLNDTDKFTSIKNRLVNLRAVHLKRPTKKKN